MWATLYDFCDAVTGCERLNRFRPPKLAPTAIPRPRGRTYAPFLFGLCRYSLVPHACPPARVGTLPFILPDAHYVPGHPILRIYGNFQDTDGKDRVELGSSPETWSGSRIDDQIREGLHVLVDDGEREAEAVQEFDGDWWYGRIVPGTGRRSTREKMKSTRG